MVEVEINIDSEADLLLIQGMGYSCEEVGICLLTIPREELNAIQSAGFTSVIVDQAVRVNLMDNIVFSPSAEVYQYGFNGDIISIPDDDGSGSCGSARSTINITGAPSDSVVTKARYRIQVNHPYVGDLYIFLMNAIWSYDWTVWWRNGSSDDGGYDDDPEDDQDIYMDRWINDAWDGDPVNQSRILLVDDCALGNTGYIDFFELWVYYEDPLPPPTLYDISNDDMDGNYEVSWSSVPEADSYELQEEINYSDVWTTIYTESGTSINITDRPTHLTQEWCYRVRSSNTNGYSNWSLKECTVVLTCPPKTDPSRMR